VVASSNFGNCATVHNIAKTLQHGGVREVSALDAPNASSNIVASTIAIWFRFGGPNLMVCSGATSGLDAVDLASILLRAGRADRVVVVGAEPDDEIARKLHRQRGGVSSLGSRLRAGAACVVLESFFTAPVGTPLLGPVRSGKQFVVEPDEALPSVVIGPMAAMPSTRFRVIDLASLIGDTYGALGVLQVATAATMIARKPVNSRLSVGVVCGDEIDGWRSTMVSEAPSDEIAA
jgi:3-oxoacyl-[acyl-carrier-protein] synthase II